MSDEDKPMPRRSFFRQGLRELLKPLANMAQPLEEVVRQLDQLERMGSGLSGAADPYHSPAAPVRSGSAAQSPRDHDYDPEPPSEHWLRPPGALAEREFLDTCSRCGECVRVCPAQCIKIDYSAGRGNGAPFIDPTAMPCVLCSSLACMDHCPSGALRPVPLGEIDMGTAQWNEHLCVRSHGEDCTRCVDHCPVGTAALELLDNRIVVHEDHCTGCGVCHNNCPTDPKSIVVMPKSARVADGEQGHSD